MVLINKLVHRQVNPPWHNIQEPKILKKMHYYTIRLLLLTVRLSLNSGEHIQLGTPYRNLVSLTLLRHGKLFPVANVYKYYYWLDILNGCQAKIMASRSHDADTSWYITDDTTNLDEEPKFWFPSSISPKFRVNL